MEFAAVLLVSLAFAAICHVMARSRDRSPPLWAVFGFLLGPIPVILLLLIGRRK